MSRSLIRLTSSPLEVALWILCLQKASQTETTMEYLASTLFIGMGATAVMDIWAVARKRLLGSPSPNYGWVGRWLAYLARGRFRHDPIAASPPVKGERLIGWSAHYLIGIAFAGLLLA